MVKASFDVSDLSNYTSIEDKFDGQNSLREMFAHVWDREEELQSFPQNLVPSVKSEEKAKRLRNHGDRFHKEGKTEMALSLYNMSIMVAPHPQMSMTEESSGDRDEKLDDFALPNVDPAKYGGTTEGDNTALADAFASRSLLLYDLGLHQRCLNDIKYALSYGCSPDLHSKLTELQGRCQVNKNRLKEDTFEISEHSNGDADIADEESECNGSSLDPEETPESGKFSVLKTLLKLSVRKTPELAEPNKTVPSLSSAIKVVQTPTSGRGLVADRYIQPGEIIAVERAYNISIGVEELSTYCSTCLSICLTPLPCPGCSEVIFCSESCRQRGLKEEHWIECKILPTLIDMDVPSTYYPHKLLKTFTHDRMITALNRLNEEEKDQPQHLLGFNKMGIYCSNSYQAVHHLCTNKEKFSPEFLLRQCKYAYLFTKLLQISERYFIDGEGKPMESLTKDDFLTAGAVLLSHILMINCNQFTLSDQKKASKLIGSGIFLTASLINHSCYQSTTRYTCGRDMVLVARKPIQAGEEVTGTYTTDFSMKPLTARRKMLTHYQFDCKCVACEHQWPTYDSLPKFKCIECGLMDSDTVDACSICRSKNLGDSENEENLLLEKTWNDISQELKLGLKKVTDVDEKIKSGDCISQEDLKEVCKIIEMAHKHIAMPCQSICSLENTLLSCFYAL